MAWIVKRNLKRGPRYYVRWSVDARPRWVSGGGTLEEAKRLKAVIEERVLVDRELARAKKMLGVPGAVYFVEAPDGRIKIGFTTNIDRRLRTLQTGSPVPLRLLAIMKGTTRHEALLHARFAGYRTNGEWFRPVNEIKDFIRDLLTEESLGV